ncbi:sensory rhodopsin transducer [Paenibacillus agaridevorans]|uniref:sensory rhodopsin transducer n=1 Tax=Paenibacillus agaridevorans TaxID=171404 RepID=UPI001BE412A9|nr:sensory rhodopsin transducer [Paenibacillus agaridevorans]
MSNGQGNTLWIYPDCELPPAGDSLLKGHESVIVLNLGGNEANISLTLYFTDREPVKDIKVKVGGERVRCLRLDNPDDLEGFIIPRELQYALKVESDTPVVVQYGRLDTRQDNMAFYTTMGFSE